MLRGVEDASSHLAGLHRHCKGWQSGNGAMNDAAEAYDVEEDTLRTLSSHWSAALRDEGPQQPEHLWPLAVCSSGPS